MSSPSEPKEQGGAAGGGTGTRVFFVDAFTETAFEGNPAAVIATEGEKLPDDKMQLMAREFNMVTAFVVLEAAKRTIYWYTATDELLLCGHGTIAACKALVGMGLLGLGEDVEFASRAGWTLGARNESDGTISLTFPASPLSAVPREEFTGESMAWVWSSLGIDVARVPADSHGAGAHVVRTEYDLLIRLESTAVVDALAPDHAALARGCKAMGFRGVIVTALDETGRREGNDDMESGAWSKTESGCDFVSRFFAPAVGLNEDPVCGSAHCAIGPYWAGQLSRTDFVGVMRGVRPGRVRVRVRGDKVNLGGKGIIIAKAEMQV